MPASDLKARLERLGLLQTDLARLLDVSTRTVNQWANNEGSLPGAAAGYLRLLEAAAPDIRRTEFERLEDRSKALVEGLYRIILKSQGEAAARLPAAVPEYAPEHAFALLRNGKITGSLAETEFRFGGSFHFDKGTGLNNITIRLPHVFDASEAVINFKIPHPRPVARTTLTLTGVIIDVEVYYIGPLPD